MQHKTWGNNDCIILWDQKSSTRPGNVNGDKDNAGTGGDSHKFFLGQGSHYFQNKRKHRAANFRAVRYASTPLQTSLTVRVP